MYMGVVWWVVKVAEVRFAVLSWFYGRPNERSVVKGEAVAPKKRTGFETYPLSDILLSRV